MSQGLHPRSHAYFGYCDTHGKELYTSRDRAKASIRNFGASAMRPYRCDLVDGMWHIGHLPQAVRWGALTAAEVYGAPSHLLAEEAEE